MTVIERREIATSAGTLVVRMYGPAGSPGLLWVHGYTLDGSIWAPIWSLMPGYRHIGLDLPGHGLSRDFGRDEGADAFVKALLVMADVFGVRDLVGLSFGGTVCLHAMAAQPTRFARAILCAPALPGGPEDQDAADCNQQLLRLYRERGPGPWLSERWLQVPPDIFTGARGHPELFAHLTSVVGQHRWSELASPGFAFKGRNLIDDLSKVDADALILVGENDLRSFIRTAELLRRRLNWRTCFVEDAGHLSLLECPEVCARLIDGFLNRSL